MRIDEIENAIRMCRSALDKVDEVDSEVNRIFASFLLIEVVAKFEIKFNELIKERFSDVGDESVVKFFNNERLVKRMRYAEICDVLKKFGKPHLVRFKRRKSENDPDFEVYEGLIASRNSFAHGTNLTTTFDDIVGFYDIGHTVLDYFKEALWLPELRV